MVDYASDTDSLLATPERLLEIDEASASTMRPYLDGGQRVLAEYAGRWYGQTQPLNQDWRNKRPISRMRMMLDAYLPIIAPRTLEYIAEPTNAKARAQSLAVEFDLNHRAQELQLARISRELAMDSVTYGWWCSLTTRAEGYGMLWSEAERVDPGREFVSRISPWDLALDPTSTHRDNDQWRRARIFPTLDHLRSLGMFDDALLEECRGDRPGPWQAMERIDGQGTIDSSNALFERIELRVYWIYRQGRCLMGIASPFMPQRWLVEPDEYPGFEFGPLTIVEPKPVNDSRMSVSPALQLMELHLLIAAMGAKAGNQALKSKPFVVSKSKSHRVARELEFVDDYGIIEDNDPASFRMHSIGGIMPEVMQAMSELSTEFDAHSGNVRQASGLSTGADTATEVATLQGNSMMLINDLGEAHEAGMAEIGTQLAKWRWVAPPQGPQVYPMRHPSGRMGNAIWTPEMREGDAIDTTIKVRPMTHQIRDPNIRSARLIQAIDVAFDKAGKAAQLGMDPLGVLRMIGQALREPAIDEMLAAGMANAPPPPPPQAQQAAPQGGGSRPKTAPTPGTKTGRPIDAVRSAMAPTVPQPR